ncbi:FAD-dependent oxidoreductase [Rhabdothermincola salaria]|uniref:FAD-dependent oxidoreductase n=1 Tax=Rhabdothermincola salaria TaxID=2903142 RepID=UPI001E424FAE|nr:FAD-dependent oxidoreductase [Rhabdothermincola salaria]MCD9624737.1 FAD-dependent oxidoreductase [Rhabdothermincola salaria]
MTERLVVIGGDAGGMAAASGVRRARPDLEIVVLEKGVRTSYAACGIPYHVSGEVDDVESLVARAPEVFRAKQDIDVRLRHEAMAIDLGARTVEARDLEGGETVTLGFDQLMIGTGARPIAPPWSGIGQPGVHLVHTLADASAIAALATDVEGRRVAVVGGGYIGVEMAEAFVQRGARVTVYDMAPQLLRNLDPDMAALVGDAAEGHGIELRLGQPVVDVEPGRVIGQQDSHEADLIVLGLGVTPNGELAGAAGLTTGVRGAISVDDHQRTSAEGVYAAGDCCESHHRVTGQPTWIALGTVANKAARVAGINLGGGDARFPGVLGTAITRLFDTEIARTGLTEVEALAAGFDPVATTVRASTRAHYFPGNGPVHVKLVHDRGDRRLLGGQIVGAPGAGKRIDTIATALWAEMSVDDLVYLDLAYAPPFSPVWDPVNTAARQAE